jgi:two-component system LytT family response regulator
MPPVSPHAASHAPEPRLIAKVLIVDDEPLARERLADLVRATSPGCAVKEAGDGDSAVRMIREWQPDLVILDIQIPGRSGFEVIEAIGPAAMPPTVFATAHDDQAIRAFEVAAVDYLLKPFDAERFRTAWRRAVERRTSAAIRAEAGRLAQLLAASGGAPAPSAVGGAHAERLPVKEDGRTLMVPVRDVFLFESAGNYVVLHTAEGRHLIRETLSELQTRLDPARHVRVHRRYVVDIGAVRTIEPWHRGDRILVLANGARVRASRGFRADLERRMAGRG